MNFDKNLKELRTQKGFSQEIFANKVGVHVTNLSKYERGLTMPSLEVAEKMANALEVSLDKLVYGSEAEKAQIVFPLVLPESWARLYAAYFL